jgi:hypothetical protein
MPTTLTGLLLFVVLLLPGFAYLVGKERHGTERHTSPFRETVAIVAASVTSEVIVLTGFAILRWRLPARTPDVGALVNHGSTYAADHYLSLAAWGFGMLAIAVLGAYLATMPGIRKHLPLPEAARDYPHESTVSAWWLLFEKWPDKRGIQITCTVDDGWAIRGMFQSFNNSADDSPDRDLILRRPIEYRQPGEAPWHNFNARYACLSARRIVTLFVSYPPAEAAEKAVAAPPPLAVQDSPSEGQPIALHQPSVSGS